MKNVLLALIISVAATRLEAAETTFKFPPAKYADFALSKTAASWNAQHPVNAQMIKEGNGHALRVLETNRHEKSVKLKATSCQSVLKMPFGWFGLDEGSTTFFWTPDNQTQIISQFDVMDAENWNRFKTGALTKMRQQWPSATLRAFDLPDETFGIEARDFRTAGQTAKNFVQVWQHNAQRPELVLSLSLSAPTKAYARNLALLGLLLRDRNVNWKPR